MDLRMDAVRRRAGGPLRAAALAALACGVGACSSSIGEMMPDAGEFRLPDRSTFFPTTTNNFGLPISPTTAVTTADLVNGQGQCADGAVPRGVTLDMTECEVVRLLGPPQSVDASSASSDLGQRRVLLTYRAGERPGIYQFVGGRLTGIERGEEAAPPAAVKKPAKKPKAPPAA